MKAVSLTDLSHTLKASGMAFGVSHTYMEPFTSKFVSSEPTSLHTSQPCLGSHQNYSSPSLSSLPV